MRALAFAGLLLSACEAADGVGGLVRPCEARGGKVVDSKMGGVCAMPTPDAGKSCTGSLQCEGLCLSDGTCSPHDQNFGCAEILEDGRIVTICID